MRAPRRPLLPVLALLALLSLLAACSSSDDGADASTTTAAPAIATTTLLSRQGHDEQEAAFQRALDRVRTRAGAPGAIALVSADGQRYVVTSGTVSASETRPPTIDDPVVVGEVAETMVATALLQLQEQGASLDDKVEDYVRGLPNGKEATLRDLAEMTSGIPDYTSLPAFEQARRADPARTWKPQELVDLVKGQPASFPAGDRYEHSATNLVLLGMVVEELTGSPLADVLRSSEFAPLGMDDTSYRTQGTGEVVSTPQDLSAWVSALATGQGLLERSTQRSRVRSTEKQPPPRTPGVAHGLGLVRNHGWLGHVGSAPGAGTAVFADPDTGDSIVVVVGSDAEVDGAPSGAAAFDALRDSIGT